MVFIHAFNVALLYYNKHISNNTKNPSIISNRMPSSVYLQTVRNLPTLCSFLDDNFNTSASVNISSQSRRQWPRR